MGNAVRRLAFMNGNTVNTGQSGTGLKISPISSDFFTAEIYVEHNAFLNNPAGSQGGGLHVDIEAAESAKLRIRNNVFALNHAQQAGGALLSMSGGESGPLGTGAGLYFTNNTVVQNTVADGAPTGGIRVDGTVPTRVFANNNLQDNESRDLTITGEQHLVLFNNNIGLMLVPFSTSESGNINVEPEYESCFLYFQWIPVLDSPLVDAGLHPILLTGWSLPENDLRGLSRVNGDRVDIGAYENHDRILVDRFED